MSESSANWLPELKPESPPPVAVIGWKNSLLKSENGNIKPILANAIAALRHCPTWQDAFGFDEFAVRTVALKPVPWNPAPHVWSETEDTLVREWFQLEGIFVSREDVGLAIEAVAKERCFHPVKQYLEDLQWDGEARIDRWLEDYFGAGTDPDAGVRYSSAVGKRWLISAVARIMRPGCKADCCLILEGPQGIKKSTALKMLAGDWFADEIADLGSKDAAMQTFGVWIIELAELDAMSRAETSKIKAFMSRDMDRFRPPYGRRLVEQPRQCVFAGSVNHSTYLKDETGGRRFWPIACGTIDIDSLARDRDQLWAEAVIRFKAGDTWWLESADLACLAAGAQASRYDEDIWDKKVQDFSRDRVLAGRLPAAGLTQPESDGLRSVSIAEVLEFCLAKRPGQWTRGDEMRVSRGLKSGGWERFKDRKLGWRYKHAEYSQPQQENKEGWEQF